MKAPWQDKTGLAKWVAIFSTSLGVATGLCGLNFVGVMFLVPLGGGNAPARVTVWDWIHWIHWIITGVLTVGAYVEVAVIAVSLVAMLVLAVAKIVRPSVRKGSR